MPVHFSATPRPGEPELPDWIAEVIAGQSRGWAGLGIGLGLIHLPKPHQQPTRTPVVRCDAQLTP